SSSRFPPPSCHFLLSQPTPAAPFPCSSIELRHSRAFHSTGIVTMRHFSFSKEQLNFKLRSSMCILVPVNLPLSPNRYPIGITTGVLRKKDGCWRSRFQQAIMRGSLLRLGN